jgi:endogenous inhibitor of DNA gyrase (YacG/DUF329 family)
MGRQPNLTPPIEKQMPSGLDFAYCPRCGKRLVKKQIDGMMRNCCTNCQYVQYIKKYFENALIKIPIDPHFG